MAGCLFNTTLGAATMHFKFNDLHWSGPANVRDVGLIKTCPRSRTHSPQRFPGRCSDGDPASVTRIDVSHCGTVIGLRVPTTGVCERSEGKAWSGRPALPDPEYERIPRRPDDVFCSSQSSPAGHECLALSWPASETLRCSAPALT